MSEPQQTDTGVINSFSHFIGQVEGGALHHDLTDAITKIVAALNDVRAGGQKSATAKLSVDLTFTLDGSTVDVKADYRETLPRAKRDKSTFWTTPNNRLSMNNPRQQALPFRAVVDNAPIKAI